MKKAALIIVCSGIIISPSANSQYYYYNDRFYENAIVPEFGISVGIMNSLTDLGGKKGIGKNFIKDLNWKNTRPSLGVFITATYQYKIGLRVEAHFGSISGYDSILKAVAATTFGRYERNLSFKSKIDDLQLTFEIHPLAIFGNFIDKEPPLFSPYAIAGIGYFFFDPQAKLNGTWYSLQPLHTEGQGFEEFPQRKPYKLSQINIPVGFGVKYELSHLLNMRLEWLHRFLTTDYLDDVSKSYIDPGLFAVHLPARQAMIAELLADRQYETIPGHITRPGEMRGDPKDKDAFFSIQFKLSIVLGRLLR